MKFNINLNMKFNIKKICFFILFTCLFITLCYNILNKLKQTEDVLVYSTPVTNKVVVIDAGHGLPDAGASGFYGTTEQAINLSIALKLQQIVEQSGAKVYITRSDENGIYSSDANTIREKKISDSKNRVAIGNESNADIFVSIHLNKFPASSSYKGWQTFYQKNNENSKLLAELVQENLNKNINKESKRKTLPISNVYIMEKVEIPTIIVECGFLSNEEETKKLKDEKYQNKLAWGIYLGIQDYFYKKEVENNG